MCIMLNETHFKFDLIYCGINFLSLSSNQYDWLASRIGLKIFLLRSRIKSWVKMHFRSKTQVLHQNSTKKNRLRRASKSVENKGGGGTQGYGLILYWAAEAAAGVRFTTLVIDHPKLYKDCGDSIRLSLSCTGVSEPLTTPNSYEQRLNASGNAL